MSEAVRVPAADGGRRWVGVTLDRLDQVTGFCAVFFLVAIFADVMAGVISR